MNTKVY